MSDELRWRASLVRLPDEIFFELIRNYVGEVKTPFNKHDLIARLESFLRNPRVHDKIVSMIDTADAELLSAIALLNEPTYDTLFEFLEHEYAPIDLHHLVLNLEERLVIFSDPESRKIRFTPFLSDTVAARVVRTENVLKFVRFETTTAHSPWITDAFLLGLFAFLSDAPDAFKTTGGVKKRVADDMHAVFPGIEARVGTTTRLDVVLDALTKLGLLRADAGRTRVSVADWVAYGDLSPYLRRVNTYAACLSTGPDGVADIAAFLSHLDAAIPPNVAFNRDTFDRAARLVRINTGHRSLPIDDFFEVLIGLRVIIDENDLYWWNARAFRDPTFATAEKNESPLIVHPNLDVTMKPWIEFLEGVHVCHAMKIRAFDVYARYELDKISLFRALDDGVTVDEVKGRFEALAPVPQNFGFMLDAWAGEHGSVQILDGIVVAVDEDRRHIIEHYGPFQRHVRRALAPGVYVMARADETHWRSELAAAGISPVPETRRFVGDHETDEATYRWRTREVQPITRLEHGAGAYAADDTAAVRASIIESVDREALTEDQLLELSRRVESRVILFPEQVAAAVARTEKVEAKGLDYIGKVRLIEQVLRGRGTALEIVERSATGAPKKHLVRPESLDKKSTELVLVGSTIPDGRSIRIRVGKIGVVRKVRTGLFHE